jgi:predicted nucleotide-binding protein
VDDYFEERAKIVAPRFPYAPLPPVPPDVGETSVSALNATDAAANNEPVVDPRMVFVVYGRDNKAKDAMWGFLESLGLHPLDWNEMVRNTGKGTPHTLHVVEVGFTMAKVFVVLMTPDDEARLHVDLQEPLDRADERNLTCQPRPNVMFEAGRAFATQPDRTILVQVGQLRRVSDLDGLNVVRIGATKAPLMALADRLEVAGCPIDRKGLDLFDPARFANLPSHRRTASESEHPEPSGPPTGRVLSAGKKAAAGPRLSVKLWDQGNNSHLLEIANRGGVALEQVMWDLPEEVQNWSIMSTVLPEYPIPRLAPQKYVRVPVVISMGGPVYVELRVRARIETGEPYEMTEQLSIFG